MFCVYKNQKEVYYEFEDTPDEESAPVETESAPIVQAAPTPQPVAAAPPPPVASSAPAASVADEPLKAIDAVRAIVAQKLKKSISEISTSKSIKEYVGGKSTMQNEIIGDLGAEFGSTPEKAEELPLEEVGAALSVGYSGALGKFSNGLVGKLANAKMPGGFSLSSIKSYLSKRYGLGNGRIEGVLAVAITMEPAKRLGSEGEAQGWLDSVVATYSQLSGVTLSGGGGGGSSSGGGSGGGAMIDNAVFDAFTAQQETFVKQQIDVLMRYLKKDFREGFQLAANEKAENQIIQDKQDAIYRKLFLSLF
jgi:3-oxoacyl-ACP reductase-like protein